MTVAFNGGGPLTIKTTAGNDQVAGGLTAGAVLGFVSGATFRLLSDQASAAIVAAAEASAVASNAGRILSEAARVQLNPGLLVKLSSATTTAYYGERQEK